jgi:phosphoribosylaminoimidazole-succinocarboxamide synthase
MSMSLVSIGKTKTVTRAERNGQVVLKFRDDITAGDGKMHEILPGKGKVNAAISARLFTLLAENGVPTHFIKQLSDDQILAEKLEMLPVEVVCRIRAAGHFVGIGKYFQTGDPLTFPIVEFYLKDDAHHDPMLTDEHLKLFKLATDQDIEQIKQTTLRAAVVLEKFFDERSAFLVDFKLEFGRNQKGKMIVGDELSPDSWRLWDKETKEILDKDRFRKGMSGIFELAYAEPLRRVTGGTSLRS